MSEVARTLLLLAAMAAGYAAVYFLLRRKISRTLAATNVLREVREEVNRILVELNQTTHRNVSLLEDRIASLAELLGRADKKIALARREAEKQELAEKLYSELASRRASIAAERSPAPAPGAAARAGTAGLHPDRDIGDVGDAGPQAGGQAPAPAPGEEPPVTQSLQEAAADAVRLAQAGLSPALIARRLGLGLGEVELILALAERKR